MSDFYQKFSVYQTLCRTLPALLSIFIVLVSTFPAPPVHAEYIAGGVGQSVVPNDHAVPVDKNAHDNRADPACCPGVGCLTFMFPAEAAISIGSVSSIIERIDIAPLVTRVVAPPLPPPKIIILV